MSIELVTIDMNGGREIVNLMMNMIHLKDGFFSGATLFAPEIHVPLPPYIRFRKVGLLKCEGKDRHLYNVWRLRELYRHIHAEHFMITAIDAHIVNPDLWDGRFLCDYIGAPWEDGTVGNSAFSIRSRKFAEWCASHPTPLPSAVEDGMNEDWWISRYLADEAQDAGFRFAPLDLAMKFSLEQQVIGKPKRRWGDTFGVHGHYQELV